MAKTVAQAIVEAVNLALQKTKTAIDDVIAAGVTVDESLSSSSENPVQNKVIKAALDGLQSTITAISAQLSTDESDIGDNTTAITTLRSDMNTALGSKQDTLTFDSTPAAGSTNPVTSAGIKAYVDNNTPTLSGTAPINYSNGVISATFDAAPTSGSINFVSSDAVKTAIDNATPTLTAGEGISVSGTTISSDIVAGAGISKTLSGNTITLKAVLPTSNPGVDNVLYIVS